MSRKYNGTQLEEGKNVQIIMQPAAEAQPNVGEFSSFKGSLLSSLMIIFKQSQLDYIADKAVTTAVTYKFADASSIEFSDSNK